MQVETVHAPAARRSGRHEVHFCSDRCAQRYDEDPARYSAVDSGMSTTGHGANEETGQDFPAPLRN
jgi:YHS domain-containing protein